jgi:hypothetical protein
MMSNQPPERIPYTMTTVPAFVFFRNDYHLVQFIGALGDHAGNILRPFVPLIADLTFCRAVDNYLAYISDLLTLIYKTTPGGKKPKKLSHLGILEQDKYVKDHLNFAILDGNTDLEQIGRIVEIRNLFTHDRGIISPRFLERVPGFTGRAGEPIQIPIAHVATDLVFLQKSVQNIDFRAGQAFDIPRTCPLFSRPPKSQSNSWICSS